MSGRRCIPAAKCLQAPESGLGCGIPYRGLDYPSLLGAKLRLDDQIGAGHERHARVRRRGEARVGAEARLHLREDREYENSAPFGDHPSRIGGKTSV